MDFFGQTLTKDQISKRIGHISQIAGTKRYVLKDGRAEGVEAVDVKTGSGLYYTILPGRGMDIAWMEYKGVPIAHIAKSGITNPQYYESRGEG